MSHPTGPGTGEHGTSPAAGSDVRPGSSAGRRRKLAAAILCVWMATLAWHVKREYFRPLAELVAREAATLPPGEAYYIVRRDGRRVGWARSRLDTLPARSGFLLLDRLSLDLGLPGAGGETRMRTEARLGPGLELLSFEVESRGPLGPFAAEGTSLGDTLRVVTRRGKAGGTDTLRIGVGGPVLLPAALPLRLAAQPDLAEGDRFRLPLFDPVALAHRDAEIRILEAKARTYADSATTDSLGRWIPAREDTVQAWLVEHDVAGLPVRAWMDEDGRMLEAETGGLRLERTAFELAFFGRGAGTIRGERK